MAYRANLNILLITAALLLGTLSTPAPAGTIYVDAGASPGGNGITWPTAYKYLQDGLDAAANGDEIWVAEGTYKPTKKFGGSEDRYKTFQMKNGVAIYGGFPNAGDPNMADRDPNLHETILSGDLLGNDNPDTPVEDLRDDPSRKDNCNHVFYHPWTLALDPNSILDGFTITGGGARFFETHSLGGGMYNDNSSPTVTCCIFTRNTASGEYGYGGAMYNDQSNPTVTSCAFIGNSSRRGGGMYNEQSKPIVTNCTFTGNLAYYYGGGIYNYWSSNLTVTNCTFTGNSVYKSGGGIYNSICRPTVINCTFTGNSAKRGGGMNNDWHCDSTFINCTFSGNSADEKGGGIRNYLSDPTITNCTFIGNSTVEEGGGMYISDSSPILTNCTFAGNSADLGGGICNYNTSHSTLTNCILWGNTASSGGNEIALIDFSWIYVDYCDVQGGFAGIHKEGYSTIIWGTGNIDVDPKFVDPAGGDLHLQPSSPCINAGDNSAAFLPATDFEGDPRIMNCRVDIGSDESQTPYAYIYFQPEEIIFTADESGGNPSDQILDVSNCGGGILNWEIIETCDWLSINPTSGNSAGEPNAVTLSVDKTGLKWGEYLCELTVSDPCAMNNPQYVNVILDIIGPIFTLSSHDFVYDANEGQANPEDQILTIQNSGGSILNWEVSETCDWLTLNQTAGSLEPDEVTEIILSVDISEICWGVFNCQLVISDPRAMNNPQYVNVTLDITGPIIELSSSEFNFCVDREGPNPDDRILTVNNAGGGTLNWEISKDCDWLTSNPTGGDSAGEPNEVTLSVDITGLGWGEHNCQITVSDPCAMNNPQYVNVMLDITGPIIELSTSEFVFEADVNGLKPEDQILTIQNIGTGKLNWEISEACDWLNVTPDSGNSAGEPNNVTVSVDISGLALGRYECELIISDPNAVNSPLIVAVTLFANIENQLHVPLQYPTIQAAIDAASDGETVIVADGTYTGQGNRDIDFKGKAITVRSMDPNNPVMVAATVIDCEGSEEDPHCGFAFVSGEGQDSVLYGITIINGYAEYQGGGVFCVESSPTLMNCIFNNNTSGWDGGGVFVMDGSDPKILNCIFTNNTAGCTGGGFCLRYDYYSDEPSAKLINCTFRNNISSFGGGISYGDFSELTLIGCTFIENSADYGGGMAPLGCVWSKKSANYESDYPYWPYITVINCVFTSNTAINHGGGIYNTWWDNFIFTNCVFSHNSAGSFGGGMYNYRTGPGLFAISNCSFYGNAAAEGSAVACEDYGNLQIYNCIFWNDGREIYNIDPESYEITVNYSCIRDEDPNDENVYPGVGNIDDNPLFADPNGPDGLFGTEDDNLRLLAGSPCIDAGDSNSMPADTFDLDGDGDTAEAIPFDIDGLPRIYDDPHTVDTGNGAGAIVDMGAHEFIPCDFEPDGDIDGFDFITFILYWLDDDCGRCGGADLTGEGDVDLADFAEFGALWQAGVHIPAYPVNLQLELSLNNLWMYQNLPGATDSNMIASVSITDDTMDNTSYMYEWEFVLPSDVTIPPTTVNGAGPAEACCTLAAPSCNEPNGLSDSGQPFTVKVTVTGGDYGNSGTTEAQFGIALLGDVNNDTYVNVTDRGIINAFWQTGSAGYFTLRDCDLNCDGYVNVADRGIVNAIWQGALGQNSVTSACPYR